MSKIAPCLWFNGEAEDAAALYTSLFADDAIIAVSRHPEGAPFPAGTALMLEFTIAGQRFQALNGGPQFTHSGAMSLSVKCANQAEIDRLWDRLCADGGAPGRCAWLTDRFGVSWQIVPTILAQIMTGPDAAAKGRAMQAMMGMTKLDIAALEAAYRGDAG